MVVECVVFGEDKLKNLLDKSIVIMLALVAFSVRITNIKNPRVVIKFYKYDVTRSLRLKLKLKFDGVSKMTIYIFWFIKER